MHHLLIGRIRTLTERAGRTLLDTAPIPLSGGRNNKTHRLETTDGPVLLKHYFRGGDWDRLAAESRFLRFCRQAEIRETPCLLADDPEHGLALHEWIDGERPAPDELTRRDVAAAAGFLGSLAEASRRGLPLLPPARDACLCLDDFLRSPAERLAALEAALIDAPQVAPAEAAMTFLREDLAPAWEEIRRNVIRGLGNRNPATAFPDASLINSPSDFGFHNALRMRGGGMAFVDFEYAGRDHPLKAILDFVCQPDFPPPPGSVATLHAALGDDDERMALARILYPANVIKFCCIMLNEFKRPDATRRQFAGIGQDAGRSAEQLERAKQYLGEFLETFPGKP